MGQTGWQQQVLCWVQTAQLAWKLAEKLKGSLADFLNKKLFEQLTQKPLNCADAAAEVRACQDAKVLAAAVCASDCACTHNCTV